MKLSSDQGLELSKFPIEIKSEIRKLFAQHISEPHSIIYYGNKYGFKSPELPPNREFYIVVSSNRIQLYEIDISYTHFGFGLWSNLQYGEPKLSNKEII